MEDFVTFEIAKKLKEKGFRRPCILYYNSDKVRTWFNEPYIAKNFIPTTLGNDDVLAPTISQVMKWLRDVKKIHIEPCILADADTDADGKVINEFTYWSFSIMSTETGDMIYFEYERIDFRRFDTYEQAVIAGIEYVLDNLI